MKQTSRSMFFSIIQTGAVFKEFAKIVHKGYQTANISCLFDLFYLFWVWQLKPSAMSKQAKSKSAKKRKVSETKQQTHMRHILKLKQL